MTLRDFFAISPLDYRIDLIIKAALWVLSVCVTLNSASAAKCVSRLDKDDKGAMAFAIFIAVVFGLLSLFAGCDMLSSLSEAMKK